MAIAQPSFSGIQVVDPTRNAMQGLSQARESLLDVMKGHREREAQENALKQQAIENRMAEEGLGLKKEGLLLQQESAKRDADKYARDVTGDEALRTYAQQLGNYGSDVVPEADAMAIQKAYAANPNVDVQAMVDAAQNRYNANTAEGAQSRIDMLNRVAMPSGEYDPTKLIAMQEKAVAKPQGTLDAIVSERAKEQVRQQKLNDAMYLANYKQAIKPKTAGTGSKSSKLLYDKEGNALEWAPGSEIPQGYMEPSMYNKLYDNKQNNKDSIYSPDGSVDQSKLVNQNSKLMTQIDEEVSSFLTPESYDRKASGEVGNQLAGIQMLTGKSADGVVADFRYLKEGGMGRSGISQSKLDDYYKDQEILLKTGNAVDKIPMSTAIKNILSKDSNGNPYYLMDNINGKVQLTMNPLYKENIVEAENKRKRERQEADNIFMQGVIP